MMPRKQTTVATIKALVGNPPLLLFVEVLGLAAGLAMIIGHNVWSGGALPVIVTLVGWLILIRGLLLLFLWPEAAVGLFAGLHFEQLFYLYVAISLILGIYLTYAGFSSTSR